MIVALAAGLAGLITFIVGVAIDPMQAYFSYLVAYIAAIGIVLGALVLLMIEQLIAASWFVVVRRTIENVVAALPMLLALFVPVILGIQWVYPWMHPAMLDRHERDLVEKKLAYLNEPFFLVRAALYFAAWIVVAELLRRWSLAQDRDPGEQWSSRQRALSAPGLIVLGFTITFAAFDWVMSLAPTWFSTIFGVQIFAGGIVGTLGLLSILAGRSVLTGSPAPGVSPEHLSAIGKLLFTFIIFWAYVTFSQLLIIWIADVPDEVTWYVPRIAGSWLGLGLAIAVGQFGVPFFILLSYYLKRRARLLVKLGWWVLAMHYAEVYWIVMPQLRPSAARPHWTDASAAAMVFGLAVAFAMWRARGRAHVAIGDPELATSLRYTET